MHIAKCVVKILVVIGALELGVLGAFNYDVIGSIFGSAMVPAYHMGVRVLFSLIGIAGLVSLACLCKKCCCKSSCSSDTNKKDKGHGGGCCR